MSRKFKFRFLSCPLEFARGSLLFAVISIAEGKDASDSNLLSVNIRVLNLAEVEALELHLFSNAPILESSSEPEDTVPPATIPDNEFNPAD